MTGPCRGSWIAAGFYQPRAAPLLPCAVLGLPSAANQASGIPASGGRLCLAGQLETCGVAASMQWCEAAHLGE